MRAQQTAATEPVFASVRHLGRKRQHKAVDARFSQLCEERTGRAQHHKGIKSLAVKAPNQFEQCEFGPAGLGSVVEI
jgi:hypothetical protein